MTTKAKTKTSDLFVVHFDPYRDQGTGLTCAEQAGWLIDAKAKIREALEGLCRESEQGGLSIESGDGMSLLIEYQRDFDAEALIERSLGRNHCYATPHAIRSASGWASMPETERSLDASTIRYHHYASGYYTNSNEWKIENAIRSR